MTWSWPWCYVSIYILIYTIYINFGISHQLFLDILLYLKKYWFSRLYFIFWSWVLIHFQIYSPLNKSLFLWLDLRPPSAFCALVWVILSSHMLLGCCCREGERSACAVLQIFTSSFISLAGFTEKWLGFFAERSHVCHRMPFKAISSQTIR